MTDTTHKSRRLMAMFLATTLLPAICLCWLGWKVVEEDRLYQRNRIQEQREQAADLAASALQRVLAEAEERLASFSAAPTASRGDSVDGVALIAFERTGTAEQAGAPLPYYPAVQDPSEVNAASFISVDDLEFQKKDYTGALRALNATAHNGEPASAGGALLRIARIHRKSGDISSALAAFTELSNLGDARVDGIPAALVARQGRALIFESTAMRDELQREATSLCNDLEKGRWQLSRAVFESSYEQARNWVAAPRPAMDSQRIAMSEAADSLWRDWQTITAMETHGRSRRTLQVGDVSLLVLTRSTPERTAILLMPPHFLDFAWVQSLRSGGSGGRFQNVDLALTDADGRAVIGEAGRPLSMQTVQSPSATQLPWTLHVISNGVAPTQSLSQQTKIGKKRPSKAT